MYSVTEPTSQIRQAVQGWHPGQSGRHRRRRGGTAGHADRCSAELAAVAVAVVAVAVAMEAGGRPGY